MNLKKKQNKTQKDVEKAVKAGRRLKKKNAKLFYTAIAFIVIASVTVGVLYACYPDWFKGKMPAPGATLTVHFIDVGQGDAIYIRFPSGKDMLIDAGTVKKSENEFNFTDGAPVTTDENALVTEYIKRYDDNGTLDYLLITHSDSDHISYVDEVLEAFQVNTVYLPYIDIEVFDTSADEGEKTAFEGGLKITTATYENIAAAVFNEPNCTVKCVNGYFSIKIEEDISFEVFSFDKTEYSEKNITDANELSPICLLRYARRTVVLTGDAEKKSEKDFIGDCLPVDCDVLKVGHHGSDSSTTQDFLNHIKVEYAVISAGNHGSFNHPKQSILDRLKTNNIKYYCTRYNGSVTLTIDHKGNIYFDCAIGAAA